MSNFYRKKEDKTEAIQWGLKNIDAIRKLISPGTANVRGGQGLIMTKFASLSVTENDYIIKEGEDKIFALDKKTFEDTYEKVKK